jgi:putative sigma-54 modulation protein
MTLEITFRNLNPRDEIRKRANALYAKFEKFLDSAAEGHLVVNVEHNEAIAELIVSTHGQTFKAVETNEDLRTSMDKVFHNLEGQLRRNKDRRTNKKGVRGREPLDGFQDADA